MMKRAPANVRNLKVQKVERVVSNRYSILTGLTVRIRSATNAPDNGPTGSRHKPACIPKRERPVLIAPATGAAINADSTIHKVTPGRMLMSMGARARCQTRACRQLLQRHT